MSITKPYTGVISRLHPSFGFIRCDNDGQSYFFHFGALQKTSPITADGLKEGQFVQFTPLFDHPRGLRAIEVRINSQGWAEPQGLPQEA